MITSSIYSKKKKKNLASTIHLVLDIRLDTMPSSCSKLECNKMVHALAHFAHNVDKLLVWMKKLPSFVIPIALYDLISI